MPTATAYATQNLQQPMYSLVHRPEDDPDGLSCWIALPDRISRTQTPVVAVHGIRRNARQQADLLAARASVLGRPVIAPLFDAQRWPRYQQAVRRGRADLALLTLMRKLRREGVWLTDQFDLAGFSGGAQFAHRFAMLHPELVARLTTASAGWYTFPNEMPFPYGLAPRSRRSDAWSAVTREKFKRFLTIPTQVCVGADDNVRDRNTRTGPAIDTQQGVHRMARAIRWTRALQDAAHDVGLKPRASFIALSACGHDFRQCVLRGGLDRIIIPEQIDGQARQPRTGNACPEERCRHCVRPCVPGQRLREVAL